MYFGHGVYGVEAASRLYFGKSAKDLELEEAALIAGILQSNVRQSPYVNMEAAMRRRNYTLGRMAEVGYITADEAEAAKKKPIVTARRAVRPPVGRAVLPRRGPQGARAALRRQAAVRERPVDPDRPRRQAAGSGEPRARRRAAPDRQDARLAQAARATSSTEGHKVEAFRHARWDRPMRDGDIVPAVVTAVDGSVDQRARRRARR